jgi:hypothetical protein
MSVSLAYDPVLSRIRVRADELETALTAFVERSTDQIRWKPVRGGVDVPVPVGGLVLNAGVPSDYASTPDTAALDITSDITLSVDVTLEDWDTPPADMTFVAKYQDTGNQRGYRFDLWAGGTLAFVWSTDGVTNAALQSVQVPIPASGRQAIRVVFDADNGAAGRTARFYTAPSREGPWTLFDTVTTATATSIFSNTAALTVGSRDNGVVSPVTGTIHAVEVRNSAGTVVANPVFYDDAATGATSFVDGAGLTWTVNGNALIQHREILVDDYEFTADRTNHYRVSATAVPTVMNAEAAHANNASVVPALPEDAQAGDLLLDLAAIRNSGAGTPNLPTDYTLLLASSNMRLYGKVHDGSESAPTQSFSGGVANATTSAMMARLRGVDTSQGVLGLIDSNSGLNSSAQNITVPAVSLPFGVDNVDGSLILRAGWKQDDCTSIASPGTEIQEGTSTLGDDQSIVWSYENQTDAEDVAASSFVVTGGAAAISRGMTLVFAPATIVQSASMYPSLDEIWLKNVMRSFLNRAWTALWPGGDEVIRPSRGAEFDVKSRSLPVAVTELGGSRRIALIIRTESREETRWLDYLIAAGDVLFLHTPDDCTIDSMYCRIDQTMIRRNRPTGSKWLTELPLIECAAPGPDIVTATATWDTIFAQYGTFPDLAADFATFADLLELVGDPSEVIVE